VYERLADLADATAATLPEDSRARARVSEMASFYRFLMSRLPELLDEWEQARVEA
jgi:hypothetical protein